MKKLIYISCFIFITILSGCTTTIIKDNNGPESTFNTLDNYGTWINVPGLGQVWRPSGETNWQPYYDGQWLYTDSGWMWVGNEPYGWVVYHYGYWTYDNYYGWVWVPSYDWQPARVRWYYSNGYIGWAPLPPPGVGVNNIYNKNYIRKTWVVVQEKNFINRDVGRYKTRDVEPGSENIRNSNGGRAPDVRNIERAYGRRIDQVKPVKEQVREGNRRIYRVRIPEQNRQNEINRSNQPKNPVPVTQPPTIRTPRPEPAKPSNPPSQSTKPSTPPRPEVNKNNPVRPARPAQPEKVRKPESGRNENSIRNEGRNQENRKRPEVIKQNENRNVKKRDEKTVQKDRNKIIKKEEKKVIKKEEKKTGDKNSKKNERQKNGKEIKAKDSGVKKEAPNKERKNETIR